MKHWKRFSFDDKFIETVAKATARRGFLEISDELSPAYCWRATLTHPASGKINDVVEWRKCYALDGTQLLPTDYTPVYETGGVILKQGRVRPELKFHMFKLPPYIWQMMEELGVFQLNDHLSSVIYTDVPTDLYVKVPGVAKAIRSSTAFGGAMQVPREAELVVEVRHELDGRDIVIVWAPSWYDCKLYLAERLAARLAKGWVPADSLKKHLSRFAEDVMSVEGNLPVHVHQPELMARAERCAKKIRLKIGGVR